MIRSPPPGAGDRVVAGPALQIVEAVAPGDHVVAGPAQQKVVTRRAEDGVPVVAAVDRVVVAAAGHQVGAGSTLQIVPTAAAEDGVVARPARDRVGIVPARQRVQTAQTEDQIPAHAALGTVVAGARVQHVVGVVANYGVVARPGCRVLDHGPAGDADIADHALDVGIGLLQQGETVVRQTRAQVQKIGSPVVDDHEGDRNPRGKRIEGIEIIVDGRPAAIDVVAGAQVARRTVKALHRDEVGQHRRHDIGI